MMPHGNVSTFSCVLDYSLLLSWKQRKPEPNLAETNRVYQVTCEIMYSNQKPNHFVFCSVAIELLKCR